MASASKHRERSRNTYHKDEVVKANIFNGSARRAQVLKTTRTQKETGLSALAAKLLGR